MINQAFNPYRAQQQQEAQPLGEVPQGLQALMVLDRTASQMGPAGPTIASQMMQRFQPPPPPQGMPPQGMPPQGMPPQGMPPQRPPQGLPGMMPNDPFRQQMMKTVQQQSQASAQPQQPPQPPQRPQGMAHGGIASLRADNIARMKYARGGVIGFAGGGDIESILKKGPYERTPEENEILRNAGYELTQRQPAPEGSAIYKINKFLESPYIREAITGGAHTLSSEDLAQRGDTGALSEKLYRLLGGSQSAVPEPMPTPAAPTAMGRPAESLTPQQIEQAMRTSAPAAPMARPPATPRPAMPAAGVAQPPMENADLAMLRRLRDTSPFTDQAPTPESQMELLNKFRTAQGQTGPVGSAIEAAIKANAERAAATEAAYRKGLEGQGTEEWISMLAKGKEGVGALGAEFVRGRQAQRAAEMSFRQLMDASAAKRDEMAVTLQNMREAAASGNMGAYNTAKTEYDRARHQAADTQRQLAAKAAELSVGSQQKELDRATQLQVARINHAAQALGTPEMRMAEWIKDPKNLAAYQTLINAKAEPALIKQLAATMAKDPAQMEVLKSTNPQLYTAIMAEIGTIGSVPRGAQVRQ